MHILSWALRRHARPVWWPQRLREWGVEVTESIGKTGVVGTVRGTRPSSKTIGLRADTDALPIFEESSLPYASQNAGRMHACGHDGHTTMLLGAARYFAENPDFGGAVHFIFQPAEEGLGGAPAMIKDGLFERFPCDAVYGMHSGPRLPTSSGGLRNWRTGLRQNMPRPRFAPSFFQSVRSHAGPPPAVVLAAISQDLVQREDALTQVRLVHHGARPDEGQQLVLIEETAAVLKQNGQRVKRSSGMGSGSPSRRSARDSKSSRNVPKVKRDVLFSKLTSQLWLFWNN